MHIKIELKLEETVNMEESSLMKCENLSIWILKFFLLILITSRTAQNTLEYYLNAGQTIFSLKINTNFSRG